MVRGLIEKLGTFVIGTVLFGILHGTFLFIFLVIWFVFGIGIGDGPAPPEPNQLVMLGLPILVALTLPIQLLERLGIGSDVIKYPVNSLIYGALVSAVWMWNRRKVVQRDEPPTRPIIDGHDPTPAHATDPN